VAAAAAVVVGRGGLGIISFRGVGWLCGGGVCFVFCCSSYGWFACPGLVT